ncbi:MAG: glycosyltransferase [Hyphomicrobiaceae bacterium]
MFVAKGPVARGLFIDNVAQLPLFVLRQVFVLLWLCEMARAVPRYEADFSLALINRTGAYHVCRDIVKGLPQHFLQIRYWRFVCQSEPQGIVRKMLGRLMLIEIDRRTRGANVGSMPASGSVPTVFMDPLYVLRGGLKSSDIVLCHDVGPITHRWLFNGSTVTAYERAYAMIRDVGPGMVFVSEASRLAFSQVFGEAYRFLEVIPLYVRDGVVQGHAERPVAVPDRFILTVSATEERKNFTRSIVAYARSGLAERGVGYIICGPRGNAEAEVEACARSTQGVVKLGFVSDAELRWLYERASGFVLPSLLEGFGVPALEAGRRGLVPLVSEGGALAEAAGAGCITVDPENIAEIADGFLRLVDMSEAERRERVLLLQGHAAKLTRTRYLECWSELLTRDAIDQDRGAV